MMTGRHCFLWAQERLGKYGAGRSLKGQVTGRKQHKGSSLAMTASSRPGEVHKTPRPGTFGKRKTGSEAEEKGSLIG